MSADPLTPGETYWTPFAQISRITNELRDVLGMLERNEFVRAYKSVERTHTNAASLWSDLAPENTDD